MAQLNFPLPGRHDVVFDLETRYSFDEVGGRNNMEKLGISLAVLYDYGDDTYHEYREDAIEALILHLVKARRIIGFNIDGFDIPVLSPYLPSPKPVFKTLDLMLEAKKQLGFRPSLSKLASATLEEDKAGDGLDAIRWYRQGEWEKLIYYCKEDVRITREIYEFGRDQRYVLFRDRDGSALKVPVFWE